MRTEKLGVGKEGYDTPQQDERAKTEATVPSVPPAPANNNNHPFCANRRRTTLLQNMCRRDCHDAMLESPRPTMGEACLQGCKTGAKAAVDKVWLV